MTDMINHFGQNDLVPQNTAGFSYRSPIRLLIAVLITLACTVISLMLANVSSAHATTLKPQAVIQGNMITLGDLFEGLTRDQERVLGPAPQPGQDMTLNARTLLRVAHAFDLNWRPRTSYDQITLKRDATIINADKITDRVRASLKEQGLGNSFNVKFFQAYPKIVLPGNVSDNVEIKSINIDRNKNQFNVRLAAPSAENPIQTLDLSGEIVKTLMIPVAKSTIQHGDLIGKSNIEWIEIEENQLDSDTVIDFDTILNMTPKRVLLSGRPISTSAIIAPRLIERGNEITMVYNNGGLNLTAKGKALQGGSKGEIIRVVNLGSSRSVEAMVTADRTVTIYN